MSSSESQVATNHEEGSLIAAHEEVGGQGVDQAGGDESINQHQSIGNSEESVHSPKAVNSAAATAATAATTATAGGAVPAEDIVGKYKRLLALARSNLEANQTTIAQKDRQIGQLIAALEEEKDKSQKLAKRLQQINVVGMAVQSQQSLSGKDDENGIGAPRALLRRVDVDSVIWILVQYDSQDCWVSFQSEQELEDFIQRLPGMPLVKPGRSLSEQESHRIVRHNCKSNVFFYLVFVFFI